MTLTSLEIVNGSLSLLCVVVSTIIGLIILSKYSKYKQTTLILVGITLIGMFSPWWPSSISFIVALIIGQGLSPTAYFLIGFIASPIVLGVWMFAFTNFKFKEKQKIIVGIYIIISVSFDVYLLHVLFILQQPELIGELTDVLDTTYKGIAILFSIFIVFTMLITGILFGHETLKAEDPEIRLKGKFLILAFISWGIGAILDAALPLNIFTLTAARLILISSAFEFYLGFILPTFIKNIFIKK